MIKSNAKEQIEKKVDSWNRTRSVKMEQAKRMQYTYDGLEIRLMFINMCVVVCAIFALSIDSNFILMLILSYSVMVVLFQNYVSKLNLEGQIREFKLLEVNLDLIINELEYIYRMMMEEDCSIEYVNLKIEMLTNKYNAYLQNIPLHLNDDYNVAMAVKKIHKKNLEELKKPKDIRVLEAQKTTIYSDKIVCTATGIFLIGIIITLLTIVSLLVGQNV